MAGSLESARVSTQNESIHLRPTASLAERVLLPGDPGRALALAQTLLTDPLMFNHNRGLWGYTGAASDGQPLTIQATGMGGPSAAIVLTELIDLGARRAIRIGTCGAIAPGLSLGDLVIATAALCTDGTSRALGAGAQIEPDGPLTKRLMEAAPAAHSGPVVTVDLFYDEGVGPQTPGSPEALAVEMEAATLLAIGSKRGVPVACTLTVSDTFGELGERIRISDDALAEASQRMGETAVQALTTGEQ
jgi:uridine phosphorylase